MSWKKSGSINHYDAYNNLNVNSIATDDFVMREAYKGTFTINGELFVSDDCSFNKDLFVAENTNIFGNCNVNQSVNINNELYVKENIYIGSDDIERRAIVNTTSGIGIDVTTPNALLDISGGNSTVFKGHSTAESINSILLENANNYKTELSLDNTTASLNFIINNDNAEIKYQQSNNSISINTDVSFSGTAFIGDDTTIIGNAYVEHNLEILQDVSLGNFMKMGGSLHIGKDISMNGNIVLGKSIFAGQDVSMNGNLTVGENATIHGDMSLKSDINIGGSATIQGNAFIQKIST